MAQLTSNYSSGLSQYSDNGSGQISIGGGATGAMSGALAGGLAGGVLTGSLMTGAAAAAGGAAAGASSGAILGPVGMIVGGLLGGLFGSKKTKAPAAPTYEQIMARNLSAQQNVQGNILDLEGKYRPMYQGLQEQTLNSQIYGGLNNQGYASMLEEASNTQQGLASRIGAGYLGTMQGLSQQARYNSLGDFIPYAQDELNRQAMEGLATGGNLNQDQQRQAYQSANSAMAMRGLTGRQGVAAGVLSNYGLSQDRLNANRQFAQNTIGNETSLQQAQMNIAGSAYGASDYGKTLMAQSNGMLGQYAPQIFNPESSAGIQAQGVKYQEGMGIAQANLAQQNQLIGMLGQVGMMGISGGFKNLFGATPAAATYTPGSGMPMYSALSNPTQLGQLPPYLGFGK